MDHHRIDQRQSDREKSEDKCDQLRLKAQCREYLSDYALKRTNNDPMKTCNDDEMSSIESINDQKRCLPEIRLESSRTNKFLKNFRYHSLDEKESGQESTLKDSGIDTASSSTILNIAPRDSSSKKSVTTWRFNETRTEQIGDIYMKNPLFTGESYRQYVNVEDIFRALGLRIEILLTDQVEISEVIRNSPADTDGQLRIGDQILQWNDDKFENLSCEEVSTIVCQSSMKFSQIHLIVRRVIRHSRGSTKNRLLRFHSISQADQIEEKTNIELKISSRYDDGEFQLMIYGAKNLPLTVNAFVCQVLLQDKERSSFRDEKFTRVQRPSSTNVTWNESISFVDLDTIEDYSLQIRLINANRPEEILGQIRWNQLKPYQATQWFSLDQSYSEISLNSIVSPPPPPPQTIPDKSNSTPFARRRQLPTIPSAQVQVNREKISQDLLEKATQLKLRLHLQSKVLPTQYSLDQSLSMTKDFQSTIFDQNDDQSPSSRQSLVNLNLASKTPLKDKTRLPIIRDRSSSNSILFRPNTRKSIIQRASSETTPDQIDSTLPRNSNPSTPKSTTDQLVNFNRFPFDEIRLNDEELRQMAQRPHETIPSAAVVAAQPKIETTPTPIAKEKALELESKHDGTVSDSALSNPVDTTKKRRPSMSSKALVILGLSKKANSASSLGAAKRYGFQRSEEIGVQPHLRNRTLERQTTKENQTPTSAPASNHSSESPFHLSHQREQSQSMPDNMKLWSGALKLPHERPFADFIEGLGHGQLVGRQVLASPCHGEIQVGLRNQNGLLEVEIVRARNLLRKAFYFTTPAPYVKVYLLEGKTCIEKQRTRTSRRTLDPLIQQTLIFKENSRGRILQVSVWGDCGKLDRKVFMGVCQINFEDLHFNGSQQILDWYKLFSANSLMNTYTIVQGSINSRANTMSHSQS